MKIRVFSSKPYDQAFFSQAATETKHEISFVESRLTPSSVALAKGASAVCVFVNDDLSEDTLAQLVSHNVRIVALRCAGFNNVDLAAAKKLGVTVVRVPSYSPFAVAEHAVALILTLNRNTHRAFSRVRDGNFRLDGLLGFDLHACTVGVIGTGIIGTKFARIMAGFGCQILGYDQVQNPECEQLGMDYVGLEDLLAASDIISLHCPLTPETHHLIDESAIQAMKPGVMLINTSRGGVIDTKAVIGGLKSEKIGRLGLDVYEEEADVFFEDLSNRVIPDDTLSRLLTFPNVLITGHQGFFTREALTNIADTTLRNLSDLEERGECVNEVRQSGG